MWSDVGYAETAACVLIDAKETVEGEQTRTPVPSVCEGRQVEMGVELTQVVDGDALSWLTDVGVAIPVIKT
jgi:hypothetical protein